MKLRENSTSSHCLNFWAWDEIGAPGRRDCFLRANEGVHTFSTSSEFSGLMEGAWEGKLQTKVCSVDFFKKQRANMEKKGKVDSSQVTGIPVLTGSKILIWKLHWARGRFQPAYFNCLHLRYMSFLQIFFFSFFLKSNAALKVWGFFSSL